MKRVLRYISGKKSYGLLFQPSEDLSVHAFYDAEVASNIDDRNPSLPIVHLLGEIWCDGLQKSKLPSPGLALNLNIGR